MKCCSSIGPTAFTQISANVCKGDGVSGPMDGEGEPGLPGGGE